jgi:hypothetical protein
MIDRLLALSVRQPWAHAIVYLDKDIENRPRGTSYRGTVLIHASMGMTQEEHDDAVDFMVDRRLCQTKGGVPRGKVIERGGIVGAVDIVDSVDRSDSPWWMGPRGFVLRNPQPIPFIACRGTVAPLFWTPTPEILAHCRAALSA